VRCGFLTLYDLSNKETRAKFTIQDLSSFLALPFDIKLRLAEIGHIGKISYE